MATTPDNPALTGPVIGVVYSVGDWEVDPARSCLRKNGTEYPLRQKAFHVLVYLLEQRERLVLKDELMERVWKDTAVTDDVLVQCVMDIRRVLGDEVQNPRFIKTIPRVGYRFVGPVEVRQANRMLTLRSREATSIEIEYEGEVADSVGAADVARTGPPALPAAQRPYRKAAMLSAAGVVLIAAVALAFGLPQRVLHRGKSFPETTLPQAPGKTAVAVMPFENLSGMAEFDWMRDGLADMFITDLSHSSGLTVLSRPQLHVLLDRIGHAPGTSLRLQEALRVARESRAEAFVLGSFSKFGNKLRIGVQFYDSRTGRVLKDESTIADQPEQLLAQIDLLSFKLASALGAGPMNQDRAASLAQLMTSNLEAYRDYSLALERAESYQNTEAIGLWQKAIALDPGFAMAYARIGYAYTVTWGYAEEDGKRYLQQAFRLSDRLTQKDALYITAWYALANHDYPRAMRTYREIIRNYPQEVEAYMTLAYLLRGEERFDEAVAVLKQGLIIDPENRDLYNALGFTDRTSHEAAIAAHQHYVALAPAEPNAHDSLGLSYQKGGHFAEARTEYNRALELHPGFSLALLHLGDLDSELGRYQMAIQQYQRYLQTVRSGRDRAVGYARLSQVYLMKGRLDLAQQMAREEMKSEPTFAGLSLLVALERGDHATAERLQRRLFADFEKSPYSARGARPDNRVLWFFRGYYALKTGRTAEAIDDFKEEQRHGTPSWFLDCPEDALAKAYLSVGQLDQAIAEYERILRLDPNYPLAHYHLGLSYERKGQLDRARSEYQKFLEIWKDADPDIHEVIAARARLASQPS